ncbi:hypothetical protein AgCh_028441 [Apium graveolens]
MLGVSYGQLLLLIGAVVAFNGPKDFPRVSRIAGRLAGRAIGYVQLARAQFDVIMHQSQAHQVHKELKETMAQLEAIRHEIRTVSFMNPGQLTTRLVDNLDKTTAANVILFPWRGVEGTEPEKVTEENVSRTTSKGSGTSEISGDSGLLSVLPVSAESVGLLPKRKGNVRGSDLVLEAIVEAGVENNAKEFFTQPQSQLKPE